MKQINEIIVVTILLLAGFFAAVKIFNFVNPWLGFIVGAIVIYGLILYINKKVKQNENEK